MDAFEILFFRFVALAFGTDDGNLRAGGDERERLLPNPPVEGNRKVLDDDEDLPSRERVFFADGGEGGLTSPSRTVTAASVVARESPARWRSER